MDTSVSREQLEDIIFGSVHDRRYTQDTPVLPDVWLAFARDPHRSVGLILQPERNRRAGEAALAIRDRLALFRQKYPSLPGQQDLRRAAEIAHLPGVVVLRVYFDELIHVVLPFTLWWREHRKSFLAYRIEKENAKSFQADLEDAFAYLDKEEKDKFEYMSKKRKRTKDQMGNLSLDLIRCAKVSALIYAAFCGDSKAAKNSDAGNFIKLLQYFDEVIPPEDEHLTGTVFRISRNRDAEPAVQKSAIACKADAARLLFNVSCENIVWAVADSGISHTHPGFHSWREDTCGSRVIETYDFTRLRGVLSLDRDADERRKDMRKILLLSMGADLTAGEECLAKKRIDEEIERLIEELLNRIDRGFDVDWSLLERFIRVDQKDLRELPESDHGTHVAGIIGADWPDVDLVDASPQKDQQPPLNCDCSARLDEQEPGDDSVDDITMSVKTATARHYPVTAEQPRTLVGMCPDIRLIDLRVLRSSDDDGNVRSDEFEVMAALQFVRFLNSRAGQIRIHGVNLSISIEHDMANYACGRTPVCQECEEVVSSGVVVVAAAGNKGYYKPKTFNASTSSGYRDLSICDPGNAAKVITVGATHRYRPHEYGVSYFSSRGPTGDGRAKPDIVAPGEKIESTVRLNERLSKDGTSMAAPHVSGAAALLMARHPELIGNPERVKAILCDTATDLGREKYFQGHGMLDTLRALQSV